MLKDKVSVVVGMSSLVVVSGSLMQWTNTPIVDNTNPDPDTRALWVALAKKHDVPIRCVWFKTPLALAQHNDAVRSMNGTVSYRPL